MAESALLKVCFDNPSSMALQTGTRIGHYEIVRLLGAGGMGEVYQGHDPRLGRDVAIKILPHEFAASPVRLHRFEREAQAAAALSHPNILAVYDVGTDGGTPYLISEYLEGRTLREVLNEGPITFRKALELARQILSGLSAAHTRGITHRDLKPENIFLTSDGRVKILDFGIAKWVGPPSGETEMKTNAPDTETDPGTILGTAGYMAPEQATGRAVDFRSDQFAFGIVLFEMLSGRRAFERASRVEELAAIVRDEPPELAGIRPETPLPLQWLLKRCLAKDPADRYESTADLHRDVETLNAHVSQPAPAAMHSSQPDAPSLPIPRTPLIGREAAVSAAKQVVTQETARLVTLIGPGGIGKTRLALQVAVELKGEFPGGVFFAPLSTIADPQLAPQSIAQACGVRPSSLAPLDALKEHFAQPGRTAPALLLLDSFEHLQDAVPFVADLLKMVPPLTILVTSREPLHLYDEHEVPVLPLPRPDAARTAPLDVLARNPAVMLFFERAKASKPDFALTGENARAIAEICHRLDGLPLAIELAAARVRMLPPAAMLARLESRLQILTGGARDLPARQQTLRGAIAWSHELLGEAEQRLFRRVSVFVGGMTYEAAEAVADTRQDLGVDVIDGLSSLVSKSLLQLAEDPDGDVRLTMMETIREYGLERLAESGEDAAVRKAHAAYYLVLAEEAASALSGPDQASWIDRLDRDRDNFRAALEHVSRAKLAAWALRLGSALLGYWELREMFAEGRGRLAAVLALAGAAAPSAARAKALFAAGVLANGQRDYRAQLRHLEEALRIYRELDDRQGTAVVLNALAMVYKDQGDLPEARRMFEESCAISRDLDDDLTRARTLSNLASIVREQNDFDLAQSHHEESLALFRRLGDQSGVAWSLRHQGDIARDRGDAALAESLYLQSLSVFEGLSDAWSAGTLLTDLGHLALSNGQPEASLTHFRQAGAAFHKLGGQRRGLARVLEGLAQVACAGGNARRALRLAGAAAALRDSVGTPLTAAEQRHLSCGLEAAHATVTEAERSMTWAEGWAMTIDQALEYGMSDRA